MRHCIRPPWLLASLVALTAVATAPTRAERADRNQPTLIVADHQTIDDLKQVSVFTGHVVLTKGTIRVTGEQMVYREDKDGYQYAVVTAGSDEVATFHQRRDPTHPGIEETIDGVADRIEYDNREDTVKLFTRAVVRRLENGVIRDEFTGDQIVYDARTSHYDLTSSGDKSGGRVTARIAPRNPESSASTPAPSKPEAPAKPATSAKPETPVKQEPATPSGQAPGSPR